MRLVRVAEKVALMVMTMMTMMTMMILTRYRQEIHRLASSPMVMFHSMKKATPLNRRLLSLGGLYLLE
jgi:hypothetical protein